MSNIEIATSGIQAFNDRAYDKVAEIFAADVNYEDVATGMVVSGGQGVIEAWKGWASAFSDVKGTIDTVHDAGDSVVMEITWTGTHDGPLKTPGGDIPATGKSINTKGCIIGKVADGKVVSSKHYSDLMGMMSQLGLIPGA